MDDKNLKKIKIIVCILVVFIVVIMFWLLFIIRKGKNLPNEEENLTEMSQEEYVKMFEEEGDYTFSRNQSAEISRDDYAGLQNCVKQYLEVINVNNSVYYGYNEEGNYVQKMMAIRALSAIASFNDEKWEDKKSEFCQRLYDIFYKYDINEEENLLMNLVDLLNDEDKME